jgi:hypothetical protein
MLLVPLLSRLNIVINIVAPTFIVIFIAYTRWGYFYKLGYIRTRYLSLKISDSSDLVSNLYFGYFIYYRFSDHNSRWVSRRETMPLILFLADIFHSAISIFWLSYRYCETLISLPTSTNESIHLHKLHFRFLSLVATVALLATLLWRM